MCGLKTGLTQGLTARDITTANHNPIAYLASFFSKSDDSMTSSITLLANNHRFMAIIQVNLR